MLRAGVLGLGAMGRHHCRVLDGLDGVDFVGVFDPAPDAPTQILGKPVMNKLADLIALGLDYCVVAAPTAFHLDLGLELAARGIHALIEKPVASTSEEAGRLCSAFADAGLIGGVGHIERFNPALQEMRRRIERGDIGELFQVATRRQGPFPGRIADVGVIKDLATHDIDLTAWVTRQSYLTVSARTTFRAGRDHEDMVVAVATLSGGAIATHTVNWLCPFKERVTVAIGESGALVADTLSADLTFYENGVMPSTWGQVATFRGVREGDVTRFALNRREPLVVEHECFRDAVKSGAANGIVSLEEGALVVEIAEQMIVDGLSHSNKGDK